MIFQNISKSLTLNKRKNGHIAWNVVNYDRLKDAGQEFPAICLRGSSSQLRFGEAPFVRRHKPDLCKQVKIVPELAFPWKWVWVREDCWPWNPSTCPILANTVTFFLPIEFSFVAFNFCSLPFCELHPHVIVCPNLTEKSKTTEIFLFCSRPYSYTFGNHKVCIWGVNPRSVTASQKS